MSPFLMPDISLGHTPPLDVWDTLSIVFFTLINLWIGLTL